MEGNSRQLKELMVLMLRQFGGEFSIHESELVKPINGGFQIIAKRDLKTQTIVITLVEGKGIL